MAGRKDKTTVDYFPHYCISGKTMFVLENKHGDKGYIVWFKLLELLGSSENHYLDFRNSDDMEFIYAKLKIEDDILNNILDTLSKLDAISKSLWKLKIVWSKNFISNIADAYKRRNNLCMQYDDLCIHLFNKCIPYDNINTQSIVKKSKVKKSKEDIYKSFSHLSISNDENKKLLDLNYTQGQIDNVYSAIENYRKNTNYKSLYLTSKKWLERDKDNNNLSSIPKIVSGSVSHL